MHSEIKGVWINSLTSGEYPQGEGELRSPEDEYCCLGVLADCAVKAGVAKWYWRPNGVGWVIGPNDPSYVGGDENGAILPKFIANWAGLPNGNPSVNMDGSVRARGKLALTSVNDSLKVPFNEIAELIRESL